MELKGGFTFVGLVLFLGIILLIVITSSDKRASKEYFRDLNLLLTGIVTDKHVVTNGAGMLYVDVKSSTISEYDVRLNAPHYYCVIHNGKADIIEGGLFEIQIGDSIVIDSKNNFFKLFRNKKLLYNKPLTLTQFAPVEFGARNFHRF